MKTTLKEIRKIIREEVSNSLNENNDILLTDRMNTTFEDIDKMVDDFKNNLKSFMLNPQKKEVRPFKDAKRKFINKINNYELPQI